MYHNMMKMQSFVKMKRVHSHRIQMQTSDLSDLVKDSDQPEEEEKKESNEYEKFELVCLQ